MRPVPREVCRRLAGQMRKIRARLGLGIGDSFRGRRCVLRELNRTNPGVEMKNDGLGGGSDDVSSSKGRTELTCRSLACNFKSYLRLISQGTKGFLPSYFVHLGRMD